MNLPTICIKWSYDLLYIQVLSLVEDLLSSLNSVISTDHVIFKLRCNEIYQMKTYIGNPIFDQN